MTQPKTVALVDLSRAVHDMDAAIAKKRTRLAAMRARLAGLQGQLDEHDRTQPADSFSPDDAMVTALAADPVGGISAEANEEMQRQQAAHGDAVRHWNASKALFVSAVEQLGGEVGEAADDLASDEEARRRAWGDFRSRAHTYLSERFLAEWERLRETVLEPLMDMGFGGQAGPDVVNSEFYWQFGRHAENTYYRKPLFPLRSSRSDRQESFARFRLSIDDGSVVDVRASE